MEEAYKMMAQCNVQSQQTQELLMKNLLVIKQDNIKENKKAFMFKSLNLCQNGLNSKSTKYLKKTYLTGIQNTKHLATQTSLEKS